MIYRFPALAALLATAFIVGACETSPPPAPTAMDPAGYGEIMRLAQANPSPAAVDRDLTVLLSRNTLSDDQKAQAYHLRATKRWRGGFNKPGALDDFTAFLRLRPADPKAANARIEQGHVQTEMRGHQQRLRSLQTLPAWFDDKVAMGGLPEAAARYRKSGLTPTDGQTYTLREAGYICAGGSGGQAVHRYGPVPAYAARLVWCPNTSSP